MPPTSNPNVAYAVGLVPGSIHRHRLAPKIARMKVLRAKYLRVAEALLPALEEVRGRTASTLANDDQGHLRGRNHEYHLRFMAEFDARLQRVVDGITAVAKAKMENEAAKTGYAQESVRDAYGRRVEEIRANRIADTKLELARFRMEHGLVEEEEEEEEGGSGANGGQGSQGATGRVERKRGWKRGMRS